MNAPALRVLSLGAGVQSTALALLALDGTLPTPDVAIFADTGWEPRATYDHLDRLTVTLAAAGVPVHRVQRGNLRRDSVDPGHRFASIPYYIRNPDGSRGIGRRQCTSEYKIGPLNREVRRLLGAAPPDYRRVPRGQVAEQWIGFSTDEAHRVNDKSVRYIRLRFPLLELGWDRARCSRYLERAGWTVAKSSCIGCPFHGNAQWRNLRDNSPDEWADAVEFDRLIRRGGGRGEPLRGHAYLHASRVPLDEAPIDRVSRAEWNDRQGDLLALIEDGDPDGCSPYGCRSGGAVS